MLNKTISHHYEFLRNRIIEQLVSVGIDKEHIYGRKFLNPQGKSRPPQNLLKLADNQLEGLKIIFC